ncbi:MAG: hypothetical protein JW843_11250 [Candidatus Aminicenantes bacterium]|nr:hypothetical protein [Candidatus Aminicenantes bacterium]
MGHWALVKFAVSILPRGGIRDAVFGHVDRCPSCQARLVGREDARRWIVQAGQVGGLDGLWPAIRESLDSGPVPRPSVQGSAAFQAASPLHGPGSRLLRWAAAAGGVAAAVLAVAAVVTLVVPQGVDLAGAASPSPDSLRIVSASVGGRPAETYIIEIPEDRMVLVWFEPSASRGERS